MDLVKEIVKPNFRSSTKNLVPDNDVKSFRPTMTETMDKQNVTRQELVSIDEKVEMDAKENLYKGAATWQTNSKLRLCTVFARTGIPIIFLSFQFGYWSIGLLHIYIKDGFE